MYLYRQGNVNSSYLTVRGTRPVTPECCDHTALTILTLCLYRGKRTCQNGIPKLRVDNVHGTLMQATVLVSLLEIVGAVSDCPTFNRREKVVQFDSAEDKDIFLESCRLFDAGAMTDAKEIRRLFQFILDNRISFDVLPGYYKRTAVYLIREGYITGNVVSKSL